MPLIEIEKLRMVYGDVVAVRDVSLTVAAGEIVGIVGPNGAGKTTTVETIAGLRTPTSGTVRVDGRPAGDPALRTVIGVQLQSAALPDKMRVGEALDLYASFYPNPAPVPPLLDSLGLADLVSRPFGKLSGGQKQRLSIALALVGSPRIVLLDELTTGLDPAARREAWRLVTGIRDRGITVVLVTHYMDEAERLCDRLVVIAGGVVAATGTPAALKGDAATLEDAYVSLLEV